MSETPAPASLGDASRLPGSVTVSNPLSVIALFVLLVEAVAAWGLWGVKGNDANQNLLVQFIIWYPVGIAAAFFLFLWLMPQKLYPPSAFDSSNDFFKIVVKAKDAAELAANSAKNANEKLQNIDSTMELYELGQRVSFLDPSNVPDDTLAKYTTGLIKANDLVTVELLENRFRSANELAKADTIKSIAASAR